ncbi:MAG: hypothetical protein GY750_06065 [Lentisphaerae bacterium]|nr:hypothetical protein [Lentisphaerota bacterium]
MRSNADWLAREDGVYVPTSGTIHTNSGHHNIAWELRGDPRFEYIHGDLNDLVKELSAATQSKAVISSEDFEYLVQYPEVIARFEETLIRAGWSPTYIVLFRRQETYALSLYAELQKHGMMDSFGVFLSDIRRTGRYVMHKDWCFYFDYTEFARCWREAACGSLRAYNYESAVNGFRIMQVFLGVLGISRNFEVNAKPIESLNVTPYHSLQLIQVLNRLRIKWNFWWSNWNLFKRV